MTGRLDGDAELERYVAEVARRVAEVVGDRLVGVWLVGSGALGDYDPRLSDIDVQAVATEALPRAEREVLAGRLAHRALPNPSRGLEFVLYARDELAAAGGPRFQLNLNTGARMDSHVAYDADEDPRFWFSIDVSIARQSSAPLIGPPARAVLPEPPRRLVLTALLEAIDFFAGLPGYPEQTVLSACRGWAWSVDGVWRSKSESARWAMRHANPAAIEWALRRRAGEPAEALPETEVEDFVARARAAIAAAADG